LHLHADRHRAVHRHCHRAHRIGRRQRQRTQALIPGGIELPRRRIGEAVAAKLIIALQVRPQPFGAFQCFGLQFPARRLFRRNAQAFHPVASAPITIVGGLIKVFK